MDYIGFRIRNFKGIRDTSINLGSSSKIRAYSLIGLNESGKTTLLEAIHSFSPDPEAQILFSGSNSLEMDKYDLIPKDKLSDFSDSVSVSAKVSFSKQDKEKFKQAAREKHGIRVNIEDLPDEFVVTTAHNYVNSEYNGTSNTWGINYSVKKGRQRNFRRVHTGEDWQKLTRELKIFFPTISYFPTFVFDFPEKIYLCGHLDDENNKFYKTIFQDILDYQGGNLTIEKHIVSRIHNDDLKISWSDFFPKFFSSGARNSINQVIDKASNTVTEVIFTKWNEIFNEASINKEINIELGVEDGGGEENEHDVFIKFEIKDGANRYNISDRSLGFRWFFCFLLFTQFRSRRRESAGTVFLFDEPASNLHARAQEKLLESFPKICEAPNKLIYSTHSHNMIEPHWLDQAYIIENKGIDYDQSALTSAGRKDNLVDIRAMPYRQSVSNNPGKTSYFQPILDKLEVRPSSFDITENCVIVEGKSDFYIIAYFDWLIHKGKLRIIPGLGATTLSALISLFRGWNYSFFVLLDSDGEGTNAKKKYQDNFLLGQKEIGTLGEIVDGIKEIEKMLGEPEIELRASRKIPWPGPLSDRIEAK